MICIPENDIDYETCHEGAWPARISDPFKNDPFFAEADKWADFDRSLRGKSPTPVKPRISPPRDCEVAYDADGKGNRPHPPCIFVTSSLLSNLLEYQIEVLTF